MRSAERQRCEDSKDRKKFIGSMFMLASLDDRILVATSCTTLNFRYATVKNFLPATYDGVRLLCGMYKEAIDSSIERLSQTSDFSEEAAICLRDFRSITGQEFEKFVSRSMKHLSLDLMFYQLEDDMQRLNFEDPNLQTWSPGIIRWSKEKRKTITSDHVYTRKRLEDVDADGYWYLHIPQEGFDMPVCDFVLDRKLDDGTHDFICIQTTKSSPSTHAKKNSAEERLLTRLEETKTSESSRPRCQDFFEWMAGQSTHLAFLYLTPKVEHSQELNITKRGRRRGERTTVYKTDIFGYLGHAVVNEHNFRYLTLKAFIERQKQTFPHSFEQGNEERK